MCVRVAFIVVGGRRPTLMTTVNVKWLIIYLEEKTHTIKEIT